MPQRRGWLEERNFTRTASNARCATRPWIQPCVTNMRTNCTAKSAMVATLDPRVMELDRAQSCQNPQHPGNKWNLGII